MGCFCLVLPTFIRAEFFVDDDSHVRCIIDLGWACLLPVEMIHPPWWLTGRGIDEMPEGEYLTEYDDRRREFMECFKRKKRFFILRDSHTL